MTEPDAVILRRTWTRTTRDANKQYSDWHLIDVLTQARKTEAVDTLCGGKLSLAHTERPGDARAFKRVCPACVQALTALQRPKRW